MTKKPRISAIAAVGKNRELGKNGDLIWRIKEDLGRVRDLTMGHPIIMGRKTHESIGKPLPGRVNIIITRDPSYTADGCVIVPSVEMAVEKASSLDEKEIFIFGGAQIYEATLPYTDRLYLTEIDAEDSDADTFFPDYTSFSKILEEEKCKQDELSYAWVTRERTTPRQDVSREADHPEEMLDLVNEHDEVVDTTTRKEVYAQRLRNYRVVHAFIRNSEGKLWIPRRVSTKKLYPDGLDFSIAGHVESGETYDEAIHKEAREEVDLDLAHTPYREIAMLNPHTHDIHCFEKIYEIKSDVAPNYNKDDFSGYEWLTPEEVIMRFESGESMKDDIVKVIRHCYLAEQNDQK